MGNHKKSIKRSPKTKNTDASHPVQYKGSDYKDPTGSKEEISTPKTSGYAEKQPSPGKLQKRSKK